MDWTQIEKDYMRDLTTIGMSRKDTLAWFKSRIESELNSKQQEETPSTTNVTADNIKVKYE